MLPLRAGRLGAVLPSEGKGSEGIGERESERERESGDYCVIFKLE